MNENEGVTMSLSKGHGVEKDALEAAARAVAISAGDGCFDRIDQRDCGCDDDCSDHEDAAYYRSLARAALVSAGVIPPVEPRA